MKISREQWAIEWRRLREVDWQGLDVKEAGGWPFLRPPPGPKKRWGGGRRSSPFFNTHVSETKRTLSTRDVERASTGGGAILGPSRNHDARAPGSQLSCRHSPAAAHPPELQL